MEIPRVAIVGARNCTAVGFRFARQLAAELVRSGVCVVSGMARGIDAAAHLGALDSSKSRPSQASPTIAVLGCGADVIYPSSNRGLYADIVETGTVVSEFEPGTPAMPQHFPTRNRIIAALSSVVVVVEADRKSGSLHTVDFALEMGREVMAVPGSVESPVSSGSNALLKNGAALVECADDVLEMLDGPVVVSQTVSPQLPESERALFELIGKGNVCVDELVVQSGLPVGKVLEALIGLELAGIVTRLPGGRLAVGSGRARGGQRSESRTGFA